VNDDRDLPDFDGLLRWDALQEWLVAQPAIPGSGPVVAIEQLTGGSQNNIFRLTRASGERVVLRRPPRHLRANSNDTMVREARVLHALAGTAVPHPEFHAVCADTGVIGVCFYVMAEVDGFTPIGALPGRYATDAGWRRSFGFSLVDGAAALGAIDPAAVGLADFGKAENWLERQVSRWRSQLDSYSRLDGYGTPQLEGVDRVGEWLDANRPSTCRIGVIHGDYQFANVMMAHDRPALAAIVDWELSTLGDPMLDLAWLLSAWIEDGDPPGKPAQIFPWDGMPTRAELVARYAEVSGRDVSAMPWFFVLACYKLGILLEGTHARACAGQAPKEIGDMLHAYAVWLFAKANQLI
jgi:aminoglycoside phosphotransferase (APT) family kinase protein